MMKSKIILPMLVVAPLISGCGFVKIVSSSDTVGGKVDQRWGVVEMVRAAGLNQDA